MGEDNFILDLIASLLQSKSKKQIKEDIKSMGDIKFPLVGTLSPKTKAQLKKDIASLDGTINLTGKVNSKGVVTSLQQATAQAQKQADSKPVEMSFSVKKDKLLNDIKLLARQNSKLFKDSDMTIKYNSLLDNAELAKNTVELSALRTQLGSFRSELKVTGNAGLTMTDALKNGLYKVFQLFGSHGIIVQFTAQLRKAWTEAKELDKSMTDLARVNSEIIRSDFPDYLDKVISKTKQLAVATKDYIDAVTTFSRAGYNLADSETLADMAIQLEKVGDMSAVDASKALLAGLQGYAEIDGYSMDQLTEKAQALNDKIDLIGNTASISQKEVAQGIQAVGSVMSDANTSVDEFIALLGAGNRAVQDSDKVALAIRTSALRIRGCTAELEEMGEETDNVAESTSKLAEKIEGLTNINGTGGVKIFEEDEETFRSIFDIYNDIAKVYDKMSDKDASALLDLIAGKNRSNQISAVLQNMSEANELLERSLNAAGTASEEYQIYLNSAEAATERFGVAMTEAYSSIINGDTVKGLANTGAAVLDFANSWNILEGTVRGFLALGILKGITTLTVAFKNSALQISNYGAALEAVKQISDYAQDTEKYADAMDTLKSSCVNLTDAQLKQVLANRNLSDSQLIEILQLDALEKEQTQARLAQLGLIQTTETQTVAQGAATASTFSLSAAMKGLGASIKAAWAANPIGVTIMAVSVAVGVITSVMSKYRDSLEKASEATKEAIETFESITSEVESLECKLSDLNEQIGKLDPITDADDIENLKLETEELERQLAILKEKQRIAEEEADREAQKSLGMTEASRYKTEERESAYGGVESGAAYVTKDEELQNAIEAYEAYKAKVDKANDALAHMAETGEYTKKEWDEQENTVSTYSKKMDDARAHANELATSLEEQKQGLSGNTDASQALLLKIDSVITQYDQWLKRINGTTEALEEQAETEEEISDDPNTFGSQLIASQESLDKFKSSVQSAKEAYTTLLSGNYSASELLNSIQAISQAASDMGGSLNWEFINSQKDSLDLLGDAIQHISQKYAESILSGMGIDTNSEFGQMLANLVTQAFEAQAAFEGMNSQLDSLQSSYQTLTEVLESYNKTGYISLDSLQSLLTADENLIAMLEVENGQLAINQEAYENLVTAQLMEFKAKLNDAAAAEIEALAKQKAEQATNQNADASNNAVEKLDAETAAFNRNTSAAISNAVAKAEESGVSGEEIQGILDKYNEVWNAAVSNFSGNFDGFMGGAASKAGKKAGDAYVDAFEKELKKLQTLRDHGKITEKQYLDYLRKLYQRFFRDKKKYAEQYAKYEHEYLQGMKSLYESALSGITSMLDKQISAYENSKSAAVESLEAQRDAAIEAKEAEKERYEQEIALIDKQIAAKEKAIQKIRDEIDAMETANADRKMALNLQLDEYNLQRQLNQKTKRVYKDGQLIWDIDTSGLREAKQKVEDDKLEIAIANKEKEIKLIEKEIDLLENRKSGISEQMDLLDKQIDQINDYYNKLISDTEKYWDNLIKGLQDYKSRWEELAEIEENAKLISTLKQLGIEVDDVLGMSEEAFSKFKDEYVGILADIYSGNDSMLSALSDTTGKSVDQMGSYLDSTQGYIDSLSGMGDSLDPLAESIGNVEESMGTLSTTASDADENLSNAASSVDSVNSSLDETASTTSDVATNVSDANTNISESVGLVNSEKDAFSDLKQIIDEVIRAIELKTQAVQEEQNTVASAVESEMANFQLLINKIQEVKEKLDEVNNTVTTMDRQPIDNLANAFQLLYDKVLLVSNLLGVSADGESAVNGISGAIQALNEISLEEGIIAQFTNLKTAIDSVTAAISGGGGESSEGSSSGGTSGSKGGKQGGSSGKASKGSEGESGGGNSLTGAIKEMGDTAVEVIGEPDAEGDGTVIGEFGSMETAVNDVRDAIGTEGSGGEGGGSGSGGETDDTLVGSIEYLGDKTDEEMGESGGDGIIGRFEEFRDVIGEADEHVKSISDGLDEIDGKEVSCTIHVNIETSGGTGFTGSAQVLGSMNLDSATYNAQYKGNAHYEGTAEVTGDWGVKKGGTTLVGELGQELIVFPNGRFKTVGDNGAEFVDIPANSIVFNHLQTKELLSKGNIVGRGRALDSGTALANGTSNKSDDSIWTTLADGTRVRELQPGDKMYDMVQRFDAYFKSMDGNLEKLVPNSVYEHQRQMEDMAKQINYVSSVVNNNRNVQQPVINGGINITCPGVTSKEVTQQVGVELNNMFNGLHLEAMQQSMIRK